MDDKGGLVLIPDDQSMDNAGSYFTHRGIYTLLALDSKESYDNVDHVYAGSYKVCDILQLNVTL